MRTQNNKNKQSRAKFSSLQRREQPPQLQMAPTTNHTFRFVASSGGSTTVSLQRILGMLGTVGTGSNANVTCWNDTVKINWIEMWGGATIGAGVELSWMSTNNIFARPTIHSDYCTNVSYPPYLRIKPPAKELFSDWISANSVSTNLDLFVISYTTGTVIDINVSYQAFTGQTSNTPSYVDVATAVLENVYYLSLDGGGVLIPASLPTTH